jgi:hypothetical protein
MSVSSDDVKSDIIWETGPCRSILYEGIARPYVFFLAVDRHQADTCEFLTQSCK